MEIIEKGYGLGESLKKVIKDTNSAGLATALIGAAWGTLGPGLLVLNAAKAAGLSQGQTVSWLFGLYIFIGLATSFVALRYRVPMVIAYSIPGAVMMGTLLPQFNNNLSEAVGAYMVVGVVVALLTMTGIIKKIINKIPAPIMIGMIGGVLFHIGEGMFKVCLEKPTVYGIMLLCFLCVTGYKKLSKKVPPIIVAIIVGGVLMHFNGLIDYSVPLTIEIGKPEFVVPSFSWRAIVEISFPMFFLVVGVQNIQAVGALKAEGYDPPVNAMYFIPAVGAFITGLMGAHCPTMGGPGTAIVSSPAAHENKDLRYVAAFYKGLLFVCFALLSSIAVGAVKMVSDKFILVLAGMALLHVFSSTFSTAFSGKFRTGALVSFFVAVTKISLFGIGAPLWAILFGVIASLIVERSDFQGEQVVAPVARH